MAEMHVEYERLAPVEHPRCAEFQFTAPTAVVMLPEIGNLRPYPLPLPHEKYSYFDFTQHAARRRPRRPQALDRIGRDLGMAKLRAAPL